MAGNYTAAELKLAQDVLNQMMSGNNALACQTLNAVFQPEEPITSNKLSELIQVCKTKSTNILGMSVDVDYEMVNSNAGFKVFNNEQEMDFVGGLTQKTPSELLDFLKSKDSGGKLTAFAAQKYPNAGASQQASQPQPQASEGTADVPVDTSNLEATDEQILNCGTKIAKGLQKMLVEGKVEDIANYLGLMSDRKIDADKLQSLLDDAQGGMSLQDFNTKHGSYLQSTFGRELGSAEELQIFAKARSTDPQDFINLLALTGGLEKFGGRMKARVEKKMRESGDPDLYKNPPGAEQNAEAGAAADQNAGALSGSGNDDTSLASGGTGDSEEFSLMTLLTNPGKIVEKINFWDGMLDRIGQAVGNMGGTLGNIGGMIVGALKSFMNMAKDFIGNMLGGSGGGGDSAPQIASADSGAPDASASFNPAANQPASNTPQNGATPAQRSGTPSVNGDFAAAGADTGVRTEQQQPAVAAAEPTAAPVIAPAPAPRNG